jgi:hypothetical protein
VEGAEELANAEKGASFIVALDVDCVRVDGEMEAFSGAGTGGMVDFYGRTRAG